MMIQNLPDALLFVKRTTLIIDRHAHAVDEASNDATGCKGVVAQLGCIEQPDSNGFRQGGGIKRLRGACNEPVDSPEGMRVEKKRPRQQTAARSNQVAWRCDYGAEGRGRF